MIDEIEKFEFDLALRGLVLIIEPSVWQTDCTFVGVVESDSITYDEYGNRYMTTVIGEHAETLNEAFSNAQEKWNLIKQSYSGN